jgi:hypothetical protein
MSLAMFAAPFDENTEINNDNSENNLISKKRQAHNKTQKKYPKENFDTNKVNSMLAKIHNSSGDNDSEGEDNFNPPPRAESAGVQRTIPQKQEAMSTITSINDSSTVFGRTLGRAPQPIYDKSDNLDLNDYSNYGDSKTNDEYYKKVIPGYNKPYYKNASPNVETSSYPSQDVLMQKLNYMITLLEDQQDEKTNNVTEEVVLYSFLGIFIIFVADTFVRAGKYVR